MKKVILSVLFLLAVAMPQANAFESYLGGIRSAITNQQVIVSNTVPLNKPLATALRSALKKIDSTDPTNFLALTKTLSTIATTLSKSSASNTFGPLFDTALNNFLATLYATANSASNRLAGTFSSGPHNAAQNKLNQLFAQIVAADANGNLVAAAKLIGQAAKTFVVTSALLTKAEKVPPPPAGITFSVSGALSFSGKTTGAVVVQQGIGLPGNFLANGAQATLHPIGQRQLAFAMIGINNGTQTVPISSAVLTVIQVPASGRAFANGTGSATVTYNSTTKSMFGTFTFTAEEEGASTATVTVTGSFSGTVN